MSVSIIIAILCVFAVWLYGFRLESAKDHTHGSLQMYAAFALSRGLPLLTGDEVTSGIMICVLLETALFSFLLQWDRRHEQGAGIDIPFLYIFSPVTINLSLSGNPLCFMILVAVVVALSAVMALKAPVRARIDRVFVRTYPAFVLFTFAGALGCLAGVCGQRINEISTSESNANVLLIFSIALMTAALVWGILLACGRVPRPAPVISKHFSGNSANRAVRPRIRPVVLVLLLVLVAAYSALVFFRIGNDVFPQTALTLDKCEGTEAISLELDDVELSDIRVCIGKKPGEMMFAAEEIEYLSEDKLKLPFMWQGPSERPDGRITRLDIIAQTDGTEILELVLKDRDGAPVLPLNAAAYPELFDEQALYDPSESYYDRTMFDEVYYSRAAVEIMNNESCYETSHPPLGKDLFALSVYLLGNNPFGWRFVPALCGILSVFFVFGLAILLTGSDWLALFSALLHCSEFMHLTLSRICTLDIVVALFILAMFFFMTCFSHRFRRDGRGYGWLIPCGISTGLAIAAKWTGVYAALGIAVIFFYTLYLRWGKPSTWQVRKAVRLGVLCVLCFVLIPAIIYTASYLPNQWASPEPKSLPEIVISSAELMYDYHKDCVAPHPYASEWYTWPIDMISLLDARTNTADGAKSVVATLGNPIICWIGLLAVIVCVFLAFVDKDREATLLLIMYGAMLAPWWFIRRTVFIYQYYVCIQILCVMILHCISRMKDSRVRRRSAIAVLCAAGVLFLCYIPVLTGIPVSESYVRQLMLQDYWRFC